MNIYQAIAIMRKTMKNAGYIKEDIEKVTLMATTQDSYDKAIEVVNNWRLYI